MRSEAEGRPMMCEGDANRTAYPRDKTIHALFEEWAASAPDSTALLFEDRRWTYGRLNERANRLAHRLRRLGIGPGTLIGLCMERSPEMIVGLLGILKAGGAYVPLDPDYPDDRLSLMLQDTGAPAILVHPPTASRLAPPAGAELIDVGADCAAIEGESGEDPTSGATADDLAYVMYTSGSTGTPKGVMIEHRSVVRLVRDTNYCRFGADEVFLQLAPISFDASTLEIWGALLNGGRLAIMPPAPASLDSLGVAIRGHGVTTLWLTAGLFNLMVEQKVEDLRQLRQLLAGGDVLSAPHVQRMLDELRDGVVINGYGPTESTTFACCYRMAKGYRAEATIPIGRPISNTTVYLLDGQLQPVPRGDPGEVCIGGDGVGRGYLNHPELTRQKFIPDPFSAEPGARLYRTGDLARYLPDGNLEFLGRIDDQVKILGHRVEPGEVEATLRQHPGVKQAVVCAGTSPRGEKRLVAYFVAGPGDPDPAELKRFLSGRLPSYMIPAAFIPLDSLPLSPNGKVDRSALPVPEQPRPLGPESDQPSTSLAGEIAGIWEGILGRRVGPDDNFFDLGGDSLDLIAVHSKLQKDLGCDVEIMDLFEYTTVRSLVDHLARDAGLGPEPDLAPARDRAAKQKAAYARQKQAKAVC